MKSVIADTNGFLRFLLNDIPKQKETFRDLLAKAKASNAKVIVPQIVIFELNFILEKYYSFSKSEIVDKLQTIINTPYLSVWDKDVFSEALVLYEKDNVSFVDCFLVTLAKRENADLFTFDKDLKRIEAK